MFHTRLCCFSGSGWFELQDGRFSAGRETPKKLSAFIATYHTPYDSRYRFWAGLLLLIRVVLYITGAITKSSHPQVLPLMTIIFMTGLLFLKGIKVSKLVDIVDAVMNLNIVAFGALSLYHFKTDDKKQTIVAYISTSITLLLLLSVIAYHVIVLIKKGIVNTNEELPSPVQADAIFSVLDIPRPRPLHPPPRSCRGANFEEVSEDSHTEREPLLN